MFKSKIIYSEDENSKGMTISEEFDDFFEAYEFHKTSSEWLDKNTKSGLWRETIASYSDGEDDIQQLTKLKPFDNWTGSLGTTQFEMHISKRREEAVSYLNEDTFFITPVGLQLVTDKNHRFVPYFHPSLEPLLSKAEKIPNTVSHDGGFLCKTKPDSIVIKCNKDVKLISSCNFDLTNLNRKSIACLFAFLMPIVSETFSLMNSFSSSIEVTSEEYLEHIMCPSNYTCVLLPFQVNEYEKQYKDACIKIIQEFRKGNIYSSEKEVFNWLTDMDEVIKRELGI